MSNETTEPKLAEIAQRIAVHLKRIEMAQPDHGSSRPGSFWWTTSYVAGSRVAVKYVSYQGATKLTKADAWRYLVWLDAGNEGRHYAALKENQNVPA